MTEYPEYPLIICDLCEKRADVRDLARVTLRDRWGLIREAFLCRPECAARWIERRWPERRVS